MNSAVHESEWKSPFQITAHATRARSYLIASNSYQVDHDVVAWLQYSHLEDGVIAASQKFLQDIFESRINNTRRDGGSTVYEVFTSRQRAIGLEAQIHPAGFSG